MPLRLPVSQRRTTVRPPVSATHDEVLVLRQRDAVGEGQAVDDDGDGAVGVEAAQPAGAGVLDEVVLPPVDAELGRGVGEPHGAVGGDRGVVAELHRRAVDLAGDRPRPRPSRVSTRSRPRRGVADQQPAVEVDLEAERAALGPRDEVDVGAVVADPEDRAVLGAGEHRALVATGQADDDVLGAGSGDGVDVERAGHADQPSVEVGRRAASGRTSAVAARQREVARSSGGRRRPSGGPRGTRRRRR